MNGTLELIDQLIAEHKVVTEKTAALEKAANDAALLSGLKEARETFVPGWLDRTEDLQKLNQMLESISSWLEKHFTREETVLAPAVKKYGNEKLATALNSLLFEHSDLRDRLLHSRKRVDELLGSSLDEDRWDAAAHDMRTHLAHTRKLLETHAATENHLFTRIRQHIKQADKRKENRS